jgi:aspartyl-tRNA(Asn)/glutamyl-tRNA(Gln) amidotransferase subunit A
MTANELTIAAARDALKAGEVTSVEITESCLAAIDGAGALNAFCAKTPEIALAQAKAADARIKAGDAPGLCGIPLGIKDLFCTKGVASQAASRILQGFKPEYESTVTQNLWDAGAVMLGKLNMD